MGVSHSGTEFAGKLKDASKLLKQSQVAAVRRASDVAKVAFQHAPGVPHRVAGKPVGVSNRMVKGGDAPANIVRYTGAAHLVDRDTKPHMIGPKRRGRAVRLRDGSLRRTVNHPGTKGKHFYAKAKPAAAKAAGAAYAAETRRSLRKVFGG